MMEKRLLLAVVLSMAVIFVFQFMQPKKTGDIVEPQPQSVPAEEQKVTAVSDKTLTRAGEYLSGEKEKTALLDSEDLQLTLSTFGASIKAAYIKNYLSDPLNSDDKTPVNLIIPEKGSDCPLAVTFNFDASYNDEAYGAWKILKQDREEVIFQKLFKGGIVLTKKYSLNKENASVLDVEIALKNEGIKDVDIDGLTVLWPKNLGSTGDGKAEKLVRIKKGGVARIDSKLFTKDTGKDAKQGLVNFAGIQDRYFIAIIIPESTSSGYISRQLEDGQSEVGVIYTGGMLQSNEKRLYKMKLYMGAKEYNALKKLGVGAEELVFSGWTFFFRADLWFPWMCNILLLLLNFFNKFFHNYGISIIMVTVLTKVITYPAMRAQFKSMRKMQDLAPKIQAIKAKYKDNPQKLNQETMELYKKHKVNPMGGCLPMLAQMPIFIAFYIVIYRAVELRGASFINLHMALPASMGSGALWITDLSMKDPTYILPVLMGATMFLQQKLSGTSMDPSQAKAMMIMPLVFTFIFLSFPSGLVLYWLVSNLLSIIQQIYHNVEEGKTWSGKQKAVEKTA
ncbi:MAG: membrane protein insertase YidC [Candidatus Aureabacteria bacterium]|nr:membrane protein insertase YidC [Candidatus Auribacterota bacterium]